MAGGIGGSSNEYCPLFETRKGRGRFMYRPFAISLFVAISFIWIYRLTHIPSSNIMGHQWAWLGLFGAELWFGFYWLLSQSLRWNQLFRQPFNNRLSQRYENSNLPGVDIFVCTADPEIEPPIMVVNTVLSVMGYDYPSEKLSVYLSDDGASDITFYALLEASCFAKHWLPFCKRFNVEPRSPAAYFNSKTVVANHHQDELAGVKKLYDEMERRIEDATKMGGVPEEARLKHKQFSKWDSYSSTRDHDTILQIIIHKRDPSKDVDGFVLPTLVYLAREKRPQYPHNFKAGAMNSLLRVSSSISNGKIILNVDCDMYSNNSQSVREALCFLMDEEKGHEIAFVQFPQNFDNVTKNDLYGSALRAISEVEFHGVDGYGGPLYIGTGCFHKRDTLCGMKFSDQYRNDWTNHINEKIIVEEESLEEIEERSKALASCTYEENTLWGKEMGLRYGCPVEDVITGLAIQCQGWKSVYYNPKRKAFLGVAPTTLPQTLVQHKRWSEGDFQILFSKYSPAWYAHGGGISLGLRMAYCTYCLWAPNCLATIFYSVVPSLYLLKAIPLFPKISSPWFVPFAYVILGETIYSLFEFMLSGGTFQGWWNDLRIWLYKRTSSYLFALIDTISVKLFGFSNPAFTITAKVAEEDVSKRYEKEIMEFGTSSPMFTLLATLALLNLFCFLDMLKDAIISGGGFGACEKMVLQVILCGFLVLINLPMYQGLFLRRDKGRLPSSLAIKSTTLALTLVVSFKALYN